MINPFKYIATKLHNYYCRLKNFILSCKYKRLFRKAVKRDVGGEQYMCLPYGSVPWSFVTSIYGEDANSPLRYNLKKRPHKPNKKSLQGADSYQQHLYQEELCYYSFRNAPFNDRLIVRI